MPMLGQKESKYQNWPSKRKKVFKRTNAAYQTCKVQLYDAGMCHDMSAVVGFNESIKWI